MPLYNRKFKGNASLDGVKTRLPISPTILVLLVNGFLFLRTMHSLTALNKKSSFRRGSIRYSPPSGGAASGIVRLQEGLHQV